MACLWGIPKDNCFCEFCVVQFCNERTDITVDVRTSTESWTQDDTQDL